MLPPPPAVAEYDFGGPGPAGDLIFGGRSVAVDISPNNKDVAIEGAESGGLSKSTDGGATWNHIFGFPQFRIADVSFDPNDGNVVYATTTFEGATPANTQSGVWRSGNGGNAWARASIPFACTNTPNAYGIGTALGSDTHQKVFIGTDCGVAYSNDSGINWSLVDPSGGSPTPFFDVAAMRTGADAATAYACNGKSGIYKATVSGASAPSWSLLTSAFPATNPGVTTDWCQIAISPLDVNTLFIALSNCPGVGPCNTSNFGGRLVEVDINTGAGTVTSTDLNGPVANNREVYVVTHRATDGDATHFDVFFFNGFGIYRQHCVNDSSPATVDCAASGPETGAQCANNTDDDGDQMVNEGCPAGGPNCPGGASPCPEKSGATPGQCKGNADDDGDGLVNDGCEVMEYFTNGAHVDVTHLTFDTTTPTGCAVLTSNDGGIGRSTDCGANWADSNAGRRKLQIYNVFGTVRGGGATETDLYFGTQDNEWFYTLNNGGTWTKAFCCEGFLGQVDYRVPPAGLSAIRTVEVNCAGCSNQTTARGFASVAGWPDPPGGGGNPIQFGNQRYIQFSSDLAGAPNYQMYIMQPETGAQCLNNTDDDLDTGFNNSGAGTVNDGCPADGAAETGAQCHNNTDDDGDGKVNDGCSHIYSKESGAECSNATDDDGDGVVNDGCPKVGSFSETGAQCLDAVDAPDEDPNTAGAQDDDTAVNDGCPEVGVWGPMGPTFTTPPTGAIEPSGPASAPTFYFAVDVDPSASNTDARLRRLAGPMNVGATLSNATGSGANTLGDVNQYCFQFYCPVIFAVDPNDPTRLYAADDSTNQIKFSNDAGATWQADAELTPLITNGTQYLWNGAAGSQVTSMAYDPENGQRILVGTESNGIFASVNGGGNWFNLRGSAGVMPTVNSFFFDNDHNTIYASTVGRGLWTISLPQTDLSITKTDFPDPVMAGQELFYTITVTNNGPNPATAEVIDNLPPQVQYIGNNLAPPLGCAETSPGILRCNVGALDTGDSISFTIKVRVRSNAAVSTGGGSLTITNTATVRSTDTSDPDLSNNTATATTFAEELSDLQVTKICKPDGPLLAGQTGTCTIYVDNLGPSDARNVVMEDSILSSGTFSIGTVTTSQGTCNPPTPANVVHCDLGNLTARSTSDPGRATVTIDVTATEQMDINDVATAVSDTPDPNNSNNQATESLSVTAVSDISLTKTGPATAIAGNSITYNLSVANNGPSTAPGVVIEDVLPAGVTIVSVSGSGGATCNAGTPGDPFLPTTCSYGTLTPATSRTMTVVVKIHPDVLGPIHNDAHATSSAFDDDLSNNFASADTAVSAEANISVVKTATPNPAVAGTPLSYQLTVANAGPSTASQITLTDPLDPRLTLTGTSVTGGTGSCGLVTNTNTVQCQLDPLAPSGSVVVYIYTNVSPSALNPPAPGSIGNTATVSSATPDPVPSNNSSTISTPLAARADIGIVLTSDKNVYKPSTVIHYQITVTNYGPSDALNVVTTQVLPPSKTGFYVSNDAGCPAPVGVTFTCGLGTIPAGGSKTYQLNFMIRGNKGPITQTATATSTTTDPLMANNSSTRVVTVK